MPPPTHHTLSFRDCISLVSQWDVNSGNYQRAKAGLNPRVITAFREDGARLKSCQERDVNAIVSTFPQRQRSALEVAWLIEGEPFRLRLIVRWNPETKSFDYL